jgi:hypothetical protein
LKRILSIGFVAVALSVMASATITTLNCTPVNGSNTSIIGNSLFFTQGAGSGSFSCSDASLGAIVLSAVSVSIFTDYTAGNGLVTDPNDNSAGFAFSNTNTTWAAAHAGGSTTTMNLGTGSGVSLFTIGNFSSLANTFTNTTSGGLAGTTYILPTTDVITGTLLDTFSIGAVGHVDAGGFASGASDAHVSVTYTYTAAPTPEPASALLMSGGLILIGLAGRKKLFRKQP